VPCEVTVNLDIKEPSGDANLDRSLYSVILDEGCWRLAQAGAAKAHDDAKQSILGGKIPSQERAIQGAS
jgi:hypothetical protein